MDEFSEFFREYGESIATRLADVAHSEAKPGFVFVEDMGDPAEVLAFVTAGKAEEGQRLLVWENFVEDLDTGGRDNYHSVIKASLAVLLKGLDRESIRQAHSLSRTTALKVLALMIQDGESGPLADRGIQVDVRQLPAEKIGKVGTSWYGYGLQFRWTVPLDLDLSEADLVAPAAGLD